MLITKHLDGILTEANRKYGFYLDWPEAGQFFYLMYRGGQVATFIKDTETAAVNRLLQPEPVPYWVMLLLIGAAVVVIFGLLILIVPPSAWKRVWNSLIGLPRSISRACIWFLRGPQWSVPEIRISPDQVSPPDPLRRNNYTSTISLNIKNRDKYVLEGAIHSMTVNAEQKVGRRRALCILRPNPSYQIQVPPHEEKAYTLYLYGACSTRDELDVDRPYNWGIQGILVGLNGEGYKELHKGHPYIKSTQFPHLV